MNWSLLTISSIQTGKDKLPTRNGTSSTASVRAMKSTTFDWATVASLASTRAKVSRMHHSIRIASKWRRLAMVNWLLWVGRPAYIRRPWQTCTAAWANETTAFARTVWTIEHTFEWVQAGPRSADNSLVPDLIVGHRTKSRSVLPNSIFFLPPVPWPDSKRNDIICVQSNCATQFRNYSTFPFCALELNWLLPVLLSKCSQVLATFQITWAHSKKRVNEKTNLFHSTQNVCVIKSKLVPVLKIIKKWTFVLLIKFSSFACLLKKKKQTLDWKQVQGARMGASLHDALVFIVKLDSVNIFHSSVEWNQFSNLHFCTQNFVHTFP